MELIDPDVVILIPDHERIAPGDPFPPWRWNELVEIAFGSDVPERENLYENNAIVFAIDSVVVAGASDVP